jgi:hypothetical protein
MNITVSAQTIVYLTTDVPRPRAYSINYTCTPHVRFPATFSSHLKSLTKRLGNEFRDASQESRLPLLAGEDSTGFEVAHIFPLSEADIVSFSICVYADLTLPA